MDDWMFVCYENLSLEKFCKCLITVWLVWFCRNNYRHDGLGWCPNQISVKVIMLLKDCINSRNNVLQSEFAEACIYWE